jgi:hypothetical protein
MIRVVLHNPKHCVQLGALDEHGTLPVLNHAALDLNEAFVLCGLDRDLASRHFSPALRALVGPQEVLTVKPRRKPRLHFADVVVELLDDPYFEVSRLRARYAHER